MVLAKLRSYKYLPSYGERDRVRIRGRRFDANRLRFRVRLDISRGVFKAQSDE